MNDLLAGLQGCLLPSYSGSVMYSVAEVVTGSHVTLTSPDRRQPSVLAWEVIARVFGAVRDEIPFTPSVVDAILENPQNRDSSTMCALVLAMRDPTRVHRL